MEDEEKAPFWIRVLMGIVFFILAASSLTWFVYSGVNLGVGLYKLSPVIEFDKGSMYMLGCGIGFSFIFITGVLQGILGKNLSKKSESFLARGMIAGVVIMLTFPQIVNYVVNEIIPKDRYMICEEMSYQWMAYKKIVYTDNQSTCDALIKQEEIRLSQPWF